MRVRDLPNARVRSRGKRDQRSGIRGHGASGPWGQWGPTVWAVSFFFFEWAKSRDHLICARPLSRVFHVTKVQAATRKTRGEDSNQ